MEVHTYVDAMRQNGEQEEFLYSIVLLKDGENWYYTETQSRYESKDQFDLKQLDNIAKIPASDVFPWFSDYLTGAPEPLPADCFIKHPVTDLLSWGQRGSNTIFSNLLLNEAQVYETLKSSPHPNIAKYHGCRVVDGRIRSLCLTKYDRALWDRVTDDPNPLDTELILQGIRDGLRHLHYLGLIHCDINPHNIMMEGDTPIITDFDSCRPQGERLGEKRGTGEWTNFNFQFRLRENDEYGVLKIRDWLKSENKNRAETRNQSKISSI